MNLDTLQQAADQVNAHGYTLHLSSLPLKTQPAHVYIREPLDAGGGSFTAINVRAETLEAALAEALHRFAALPKKPVLHPWPEPGETTVEIEDDQQEEAA